MKHLLVSITILLSTPIFAASFDCSKAGSPFEKAICSNQTLSSLDEKLADAYKNARASSQNPDQLKAEQINWIKSARACGTDAGCIESSYKARLAILTSTQAVKTSPQPAQNTVNTSDYSNDKNIGACVAVVNWREQTGKPVSKELIAVRNKYGNRVQSVIQQAGACANSQGSLSPDCLKKKLSPADFSLFDGFDDGIQGVKAPQDPKKLPNYEMLSLAYCAPLMR